MGGGAKLAQCDFALLNNSVLVVSVYAKLDL